MTFMLCTVELMLAGICINIPMLRPFYLRWRQRSKMSQSGHTENTNVMMNGSKSGYLASAKGRSQHDHSTWIELVCFEFPLPLDICRLSPCNGKSNKDGKLTRYQPSRRREATTTTANPRGSSPVTPTPESTSRRTSRLADPRQCDITQRRQRSRADDSLRVLQIRSWIASTICSADAQQHSLFHDGAQLDRLNDSNLFVAECK